MTRADGFPPIRQARYTQAWLEAVKVAITKMDHPLGDSVVGNLNYEYRPEQMAHEVSTYVLAERLPPEHVVDEKRLEVRYPDGWWEMFRHTYGDRWWMRWHVARRPVRWHAEVRHARLKVDLRRFWTFPQASIAIPELGRPVAVAQWDSTCRFE